MHPAGGAGIRIVRWQRAGVHAWLHGYWTALADLVGVRRSGADAGRSAHLEHGHTPIRQGKGDPAKRSQLVEELPF